MADKKISALTASSTPLAGTEVLPIVQSSATVKVAVSDLTAGRAVSAASLTLTTPLAVANGGTNASTASITSFNNITGFTASGTTGTTSTNLVFATTPTLVGDVTLSTGNLVIGTDGKGIDFSATPGTGTSELLNDYEEGTWTPSQGAGLTVVGTFSSTGRYTKIGRQVTVSGTLDGSTSIAVAPAQILCGNLPFSPAGNNVGALSVSNLNQFGGTVTAGTNIYSTSSTTVDTQILFNTTFTI